MPNWWMVRAERKSAFLEDFLAKGIVTIGGRRVGDLTGFASQKAVGERVAEIYPDWKPGAQRMWASQIYRFAKDIRISDRVLTYDTQQRIYHVGTITGDYAFQLEKIGDHPNYRNVKWEGTVSRDSLSTSTKNSLGAISSLFRIQEEAATEIQAVLDGNGLVDHGSDKTKDSPDEKLLLEDLEEKALEFIKDRLSRLDWSEMQDLVAGILQAMGYKTRVSPSGPDRGKDIIASPDGFGFESPRIVVEVKHRGNSTMGSQEIRSFLGGRHQDDKGLYVSTGGFSKDAYYEAERANIPLTLMNMDDLVLALVENYEKLDVETKQLVPLRKFYWPI